ncbi:MAG: hypothetical protein MJZ64_03455 [Paludibacteraceae bacterium]|nr:hypothetical protein [Paludibacteraceae bacterium]
MVDLPYLCDFENETENANWVLNPSVETIITNNRWVIGSAEAYTGNKAMYVSNDGGNACYYANTNNVLLAYRDITLDAGDYDVAYDWKGTGNGKNGYLKVVYASRPTSGIKCLGNSAEPTWVGTAVQLMGANVQLNAADNWYHVQSRITIPVAQANKTTTRLFFVWVNTDAKVDSVNTSVVVDNFQLAKASPNDYPTNISVSTSLGTSVISWEGSAASYEVLYRKKTDNEFTALEVKGNTVSLKNVEYGAYEFWICGVNGEDKTVYTVFPLVYIYETDCFDALNMYNASFEYGSWQHASGKNPQGYERVDFGPDDIRSRHTTHFDTTEIDPRTVIRQGRDTAYCLHTVPTGEFGSIRLGNWNTGSQYESITFQYSVESNSNAVLIIHYAMVLENPDHTDVSQPRFTLDVLDEDGNPIDTKCASVDFHAPTSQEMLDPEKRKIWHESTWEGKRVDWQEWRTIGISMEEYIGRTLTITLTSYDCDQGGHFGYAYFMLNCSRSDVDGLPWGEGSTTQKFTAPKGFAYAWFNRIDKQFRDTLSKEREFYVQESDTNTYLCHVTYPTNAECGYWFDASAKPHNPVAELDWKWTPSNCVNGFTYWNRCHISLTNQQTGEIEHRYDKQVEQSYLSFNGSEYTLLGYPQEGFYVPAPDEGGQYELSVCTGVYVNDELFADTAYYTVVVPAIAPVETHQYDSICQGSDVEFPKGSFIHRSVTGDYYDSLKSVVTGCDSVVILHLLVHPFVETALYDTMCINGQYVFGDMVLTKGGDYSQIFTNPATGCDSMVTLHLEQAKHPVFTGESEEMCFGEPYMLTVQNASTVDSFAVWVQCRKDTQRYVYNGHQDVVTAVLPNDAFSPGLCTMHIQTFFAQCDTLTDTLNMVVNLKPSLVVEARFDDVLVLLNEQYNGGYSYASYQWYKEGKKMNGATESFYALPDSRIKDEVYSVRVVLSDGTPLWICPFTFAELKAKTDISDVLEDVTSAQRVLYKGMLYIQTGGVWHSVLGQPVNKIKQR